jgi:cellulose synthase/poly-beta-1,6-N-acetylglucosamine synthase-like glycosyltransferase
VKAAQVIISLLQAVVLIGLAYHYLLLIAGALGSGESAPDGSPGTRFAVAIPAHNEELVIGQTVARLMEQDYPADRFNVYVVADHCDDATAQAAGEAGAVCYERGEPPRGRKAYALQWLFDRILERDEAYDALVVFDADSRVDPGFLAAMDRGLAGGRRVLQGQHVIVNPRQTRFSGLAAVDMRLNNLLRNRAKETLGLSCRLMGDGMAFAADVIRQHGWPAQSLGEDREYGLYLLTQGLRVGYVPQARTYGQAAPGWRDASTQRLRWYGGALHIQRAFALPLLKQGLLTLDWAALDQAVELLLPSFSVLTALSVAVAGVQALFPSLSPLFPLPVSLAFVLAWALFPALGLWAAGAPAADYRALLYAPVYLLWRLWIGLSAWVQGDRVRWVRTGRREEEAHRRGADGAEAQRAQRRRDRERG